MLLVLEKKVRRFEIRVAPQAGCAFTQPLNFATMLGFATIANAANSRILGVWLTDQ